MPFEKFLMSMQTIFTGFYENGDILKNSHNIRLLFQKLQNPILTQIKASLQVYYDLNEANTETFNFAANRLAEETASLVDHMP